jgi:hypothetical protein
MYCECVFDSLGCCCCGRGRPWHEGIKYSTVHHVRRAFPELAPGYGSGLGWLHIVATGRSDHDNGYWGGGNKFINDVFDNSRRW